MKEKKVSKWMREHKMSIFVIVSAVVMLIGLSYALTIVNGVNGIILAIIPLGFIAEEALEM